MQLNKEKAEFLNNAIDEWQSQQLLSEQQSQQLKQSITVRKFDWKQVTIYAFIIAVACAVLSVIVLLADKPLRAIIEKFTQITDFGISSLPKLAQNWRETSEGCLVSNKSTGLRPDINTRI